MNETFSVYIAFWVCSLTGVWLFFNTNPYAARYKANKLVSETRRVATNVLTSIQNVTL